MTSATQQQQQQQPQPPQYDPSALPPLDVDWHREALKRVGGTQSRVRRDAEAAANDLLASLRSPLQVAELRCTDEHQLLMTCVEEMRSNKSADSGGAAFSRWRQNLVLASSGSTKHVSAVEEMAREFPDAMPQSAVGVMVRPCVERMAAFRRCCDSAVSDWFKHLASIQKGQQQQSSQQQE